MNTTNEKTNLPKTERGLRTYFDNNLTVIKDNALFKVLFKLVSLQLKEYNKAVKNKLPTDNITFQYSLNEFRMDLQMGKSTIIKKLDLLSDKKNEDGKPIGVGLLTITSTKDNKDAYKKNTYQFDIENLNKIVEKLNGMRRLQRIEYINKIFGVATSKSFSNINEDKFENTNNEEEKPIYKVAMSEPPIEKQKEIVNEEPQPVLNEVTTDVTPVTTDTNIGTLEEEIYDKIIFNFDYTLKEDTTGKFLNSDIYQKIKNGLSVNDYDSIFKVITEFESGEALNEFKGLSIYTQMLNFLRGIKVKYFNK